VSVFLVSVHDAHSARLARQAGADGLLLEAAGPGQAPPGPRAAVQARLAGLVAEGRHGLWVEEPPLLVAAGRQVALAAADELLAAGAWGLAFPATAEGLEALLHAADVGADCACLVRLPHPCDAVRLGDVLVAVEDAAAAGAQLLLVDQAPAELREHLASRLAVPVVARPGNGPHRLVRFADALGEEEAPGEAEEGLVVARLAALAQGQRPELRLDPAARAALGLTS
jgi:hypothetical protein